MDYLHRGMKEALRLHPPLIMLMRYVHEAFDCETIKGETIHVPRGDIICTSPTFSHRLESVYKDPDAYDPDRFGPGREEDKQETVGSDLLACAEPTAEISRSCFEGAFPPGEGFQSGRRPQ